MPKTIIATGLLAALATVITGCEATAKSDLAEPTWQGTASYERIFAQKATAGPIARRPWPQTTAGYEPCIVTHFGSYYDDPFVTTGDGDNAYGWTALDAVAFGYSPARFVVNTLAVPISMIKEPPGILTTTDLDIPINEERQE